MNSVSITRQGKTYSGQYTVNNSIITVEYKGRTKRTQVGGMRPDTLAETILGELIVADIE